MKRGHWIALGVLVLVALAEGGRRLLTDSTKLEDLHPKFQPLVREWSKRMGLRGIQTRLTFTTRSSETQARLRAEGRSKVKTGWHNVGLAFDFLPRSSAGWVFPGPKQPAAVNAEINRLLQAGGEEGEKLGMVWGGRWAKFPDAFHLEWHPGLTIKTAVARLQQQGRGFNVG